MNLKERMKAFEDVTVYPVITESFCGGRKSLDVCKAVMDGGAKIVQLREKELDSNAMRHLAEQYRKVTESYKVLLIINDYVDIALEMDADGIHLGQDDRPVDETKALAPGLLVGLSTHDEEEVGQAQSGKADYINIGPVFPTQTKAHLNEGIGLDGLEKLSKLTDIPFTVMGGIKTRHLDQLLELGIRRIAMVTEITQAGDIARQVYRIDQKIRMKKV